MREFAMPSAVVPPILTVCLRYSVFVHRYRDAEASIRMECIKALGQWMKVHPDYFLEGNYLRYIGWTLTDLVSDELRVAQFPFIQLTHI